MGEHCGSWIPQQLHFDWQSPNLSSFVSSPDTGKQNDISAFMNSGINAAPRNEIMPVNSPSVLPRMQLGHSNEPNGWFYCMPRFRQAFMPVQKFTAEEKLPATYVKDIREDAAPSGQSGMPQKQFLVIDQSGHQTTFIYSSGFGNPIECLAPWQSKLNDPNILNGDEASRRDIYNLKGPALTDKIEEDQGTDVQSEMHEDTEEINALLYSDSYGYSTEDEDEVTSTGHSPSTMTTHDNEDFFKRSTEEVASSIGKTNKRKLLDRDYYDGIQLLDTASSLNLDQQFDNGDDAESRFTTSGGDNGEGSGESCSLSGNKKMRKERIRDILSVLQGIIPGGKDKDPVVLLDEAICCLKSLKDKARALGLDAF